jgi:hypothetical protein
VHVAQLYVTVDHFVCLDPLCHLFLKYTYPPLILLKDILETNWNVEDVTQMEVDEDAVGDVPTGLEPFQLKPKHMILEKFLCKLAEMHTIITNANIKNKHPLSGL